MPTTNYYDDIDYEDYQLAQETRNQNLLAGIGTGAAAGASVGSAFSPIGTVIGGVVGGVGGAIAGSVQSSREQTALREAYERDLEIQRRLAEVDHLDPFVASAGLLQGNVEQEAEMSARQAAARGGLSEAAAQEFAQAGRQRAALGRSTAIAAAVPAAAQADIMERQRIIAEETGRQDLFDRATQGPDAIAQFGAFGGAAAAVAGQATAAGGPLGPEAAGGPAGAGTAPSGMAQAGRSGAGNMTPEQYAQLSPEDKAAALNALDEPSTLFGRMRSRGGAGGTGGIARGYDSDPSDVAFSDALATRTGTVNAEGGFAKENVQVMNPVTGQIETRSVDVLVKQEPELEAFVESGNAQMIAGQQNALVSDSLGNEDFFPDNRLVGKSPQDMNRDLELASETIALDLQSGRVSQLEFEEILAADPNAVADPVSWGNAVANYRMQTRRNDIGIGEAYDGAYSPSEERNYIYPEPSPTLSDTTIDALLR